MWCIPKVDVNFVAQMEDVLDLYAEPPNKKLPVVCFDESPRQLIGESRVPVAAKPGRPARFDYEYVRNGTANVFMFLARRIPTKAILVSEVQAWGKRRNLEGAHIKWLFTVEHARKKLGRAYEALKPRTTRAAA